MSTGSNRCSKCRRKTLLLSTCKCTKVVCISCRYPQEHECTFDYTEEGKKSIEKNNPQINGTKLENKL